MSSNVIPVMDISPVLPVRFNDIFFMLPKQVVSKNNTSLITRKKYLSSSLFHLMGCQHNKDEVRFLFISTHLAATSTSLPCLWNE